MSLVSESDVRSGFNIGQDFPSGPILEAVSVAANAVRKFVGEIVYQDAEASSPSDPVRAGLLKAAESRLSVYYLILNAGSLIRHGGIVKSEQDAAGPVNGTVINQYLTPAEISRLRELYMKEAMELLGPYFDRDAGVDIIGPAGIEVGRMFQTELEADCNAYLI
ncbi:MAG: hypothetical protein AB1477_06380 [Acidobacteriota bacterium]